MDDRSWWQMAPDPPALALPDDLRARDPLQGRDCGWVGQMTPFVEHFARTGDTVLDPFCGFGSTLLAATLAGRGAIGIEVDPQRADIARERLRRHGSTAQVLTGALPQLAFDREVQLCLTNVPYFGCGWQGDALPEQLYARASYAQYLAGLRDVFHAVRARLVAGGHCIAMVENIVVGGRAVPLVHDLARILGGLFTACEERVLCYARPVTALAPGASRSNRSHETALVFRKQRDAIDPAAAATLLAALRADGFAFNVHGSHAAWLAAPDEAAQLPADVDLYLPHDQARLDALLEWLVARGFGLSLWGEAVAPSMTLATLQRVHYLRAEHLGADGALLRLDLSLSPTDAGAD